MPPPAQKVEEYEKIEATDVKKAETKLREKEAKMF